MSSCSLLLMNDFFVFNKFHNRSMTKNVMRPACLLVSEKVARDSKQVRHLGIIATQNQKKSQQSRLVYFVF